MAAADRPPSALPGRDMEMPPAARRTDRDEGTATSTCSADGGARVLRQRRHTEDPPPQEPSAASVVPSPCLMEEARPLDCTSHYDALKDRVYQVLYVAVVFACVFLLSGLASTLLGWYVGTPLTFTGFALAVACWVAFLCTCAERSRAFLVAIAPGYLLDFHSSADEDDRQRLWDPCVEDVASADDAADYMCQ
ncbi:hypothetical protein MTO96_034982 [Rhipicephalus appendiculatus]